MHIDWINPVIAQPDSDLFPGCNNPPNPCALNISFQPTANAPNVSFSSQYNFTSSSETTTSQQATTSYSFAFTATGTQQVGFGDPDVDGVSVELKESASSTYQKTLSTTFNNYQSQTYTQSVTSGDADQLLSTTYRLNIYNYPVVGQYACPAAIPNCSADQMQPLIVQYSPPDTITYANVSATLQDWYQPVHEPGNIFSYPCDLPELLALNTGLTPLTQTPAEWDATDDSQSSYSTAWAKNSGTSQSTGSTNTHTMDFSESISAHASIGEWGIGASDTFEENTSQSFASPNTSTQTVSASTGMLVTKPPFPGVVEQNYLHYYGGYVLGLANEFTVQVIPLKVDNQATGPLTLGFVANSAQTPLQEQLPFWSDAYNLPDVAVNHPARRAWNTATLTATFNAPSTEESPVDQPFYQMKGFLITPANAGGQGPQLSQASDGDQLLLQAWIYNYNLAEMPPGTQVHVRFYVQGHDTGTSSLAGNSIQIGDDVTLAPIPAFPVLSRSSQAGQPSSPNWVLASTTFDTTGYGGSNGNSYVFWVVTWMEDASSNLVLEIPDHGLTQVPGSPNQITDVPIQAYSNNVGFYGINSPSTSPLPPPRHRLRPNGGRVPSPRCLRRKLSFVWVPGRS